MKLGADYIIPEIGTVITTQNIGGTRDPKHVTDEFSNDKNNHKQTGKLIQNL